MSSDQRPAKVRVFSSQSGAAARRRGDAAAAASRAVAEPAAAPVPVEAPRRGAKILLAGLFLLGCAIGGATLSLLGLSQGMR